jgi:uncharacterized protein YkwD
VSSKGPKLLHSARMLRRSLVVALGVVLALALAACSTDSADGDRSGPATGRYEGDRISFTLTGDVLSDWTLTDITCAEAGCSKGLPSRSLSQIIVLRSDSEPFDETLDDVAITGTFVSSTRIEGTWTYLPGSCCTSAGTWAAEWVEPEPPVDTGATDPGSTTGIGTGGTTTAGTTTNGTTTNGTTTDGGTTSGGGDTGTGVDPGEYVVAEGADEAQTRAMDRTNWYRANAGLPMIDNDAACNEASQAHADYYALHIGSYSSGAVPGGAHAEDPALTEGFSGESFGDRMKTAGYSGNPGFEVMAFLNHPESSVDGWMETVYHRIPFMSPDMIHTGYGGAKGVDVMDFGRGSFEDKQAVFVYPWPDQTNVPASWSGNEGPQPPPPTTGYPSGPVITAHTSDGAPLDITIHRLVGPDGQDIEHVWLPRGFNNFLRADWALYANDPLQPGTSYTVVLEGTLSESDWSRTWSFATRP